jgi:hypothetical protein
MPSFSEQIQNNIAKIQAENSSAFARAILEARSQYLSVRMGQDPQIKNIYITAVTRLSRDISKYTPGTLTQAHYMALLNNLSKEVGRELTTNLRDGLNKAVAAGAQPINKQMETWLRQAQAPLDFAKLQTGFGEVNRRAVEAHWARSRNGMTLSDRIWDTATHTRDNIRSIITEAIATGRDPIKVAADLERYVNDGAHTIAGAYPNMMERMKGRKIPQNLSYEGLRLARTEMASAFQEGVYASGQANPAYKGARWLLSSSHPMPDICDTLAEADLYNLGPGGYAPGHEPPIPHSNCLCVTVPIIEDDDEFVDRLKGWLNDPESDADLETWYTDVYGGDRS